MFNFFSKVELKVYFVTSKTYKKSITSDKKRIIQ